MSWQVNQELLGRIIEPPPPPDVCELWRARGERLGAGITGETFIACDRFRGCSYALKQLAFGNQAGLQKEVEMATFAAQQGFGAHIYGWAVCDGWPVIAYDRWDTTLFDYMDLLFTLETGALPSLVTARIKLEEQVNRMTVANFMHGDAHLNNVMVRLDAQGNVTDATFIDFDESFFPTHPTVWGWKYASFHDAAQPDRYDLHRLNEHPLVELDRRICWIVRRDRDAAYALGDNLGPWLLEHYAECFQEEAEKGMKDELKTQKWFLQRSFPEHLKPRA